MNNWTAWKISNSLAGLDGSKNDEFKPFDWINSQFYDGLFFSISDIMYNNHIDKIAPYSVAF